LLGASLTTEYRAVLSAGFVALLAGSVTLDGEAPGGELLRGGVRDGGERDVVRPTRVPEPVGGAGGGVDGASGRLSRARSVRLPPEPLTEPAAEAGVSVGAGTWTLLGSCSRSVALPRLLS
jgi:hypothetical protein